MSMCVCAFVSSSLADTTRLQTLIQILAAEESCDLADTGHQYAMTYSASSLQACAAARELMTGLTQVETPTSFSGLSCGHRLPETMID